MNALKSCSIETLPNILIVDFVRYNLGRKNSEIITYPKSMKMTQYLSSSIDEQNAKKLKNGKSSLKHPQTQEDRETVYDLYGIIVHQGSSRQFGHYYSYCRGFESSNSWYKCNDESVTKLGGIEGALDK